MQARQPVVGTGRSHLQDEQRARFDAGEMA